MSQHLSHPQRRSAHHFGTKYPANIINEQPRQQYTACPERVQFHHGQCIMGKCERQNVRQDNGLLIAGGPYVQDGRHDTYR